MTGTDSFLCETCGYDLTGAARIDGANCPECGHAVAESLPRRRSGSPWQIRSPAFSAWFISLNEVMWRPKRLFRRMTIESRTSRTLLNINVVAASAMAMAAVFSHRPKSSFDEIVSDFVLPALIGCVVLRILTGIEELGVRFFGSRRGWRITRTVARSVVSHASYGWVLGAVAFGALLLLQPLIERLIWLVPAGKHVPSWSFSLLPLAGAFGGLLVFESLVATGVRQCRWANPPEITLPFSSEDKSSGDHARSG